jgi:electron transfer flavoprotein-quinone oxidoreductase
MVLTDRQALTVDYRTEAWGEAPYNGATAYRPDWDAWLAGRAEAEGARLVCSTTVTGLLRDGPRVVGVRTDRPGGELTAFVVIAADGVNSFLAKEAGLYARSTGQLHGRRQGRRRACRRRSSTSASVSALVTASTSR